MNNELFVGDLKYNGDLVHLCLFGSLGYGVVTRTIHYIYNMLYRSRGRCTTEECSHNSHHTRIVAPHDLVDEDNIIILMSQKELAPRDQCDTLRQGAKHH